MYLLILIEYVRAIKVKGTVASYELIEDTDSLTRNTRYATHNNSLYRYNNRNLLDTTTHPDTTTEIRDYDGVGNLLTHTNEKSKVTTYTYDKENRQTSVEFAGELTQKNYDANGNRIEIRKPLGNIRAMEYDYLNTLIAVIDDPGGGLDLTITYEYDANSNLLH